MLENYFITPDLLLRYVAKANMELGLFALDTRHAEDVLSQLIRERVFGGNKEDYLVWQTSAANARRLIWEAKTQAVKLSSFAEEFFRRLKDLTGVEMLLTKGEFHRLVESVDKDTIGSEVIEKLDWIADLFQQAAAMTEVPLTVEDA